uniref:JmjC domain-containing protein n=1 Tax=Auxenochlorella protothecoides TaxID=3075 RepID=A0A1D1ZUM8_AUXPR
MANSVQFPSTPEHDSFLAFIARHGSGSPHLSVPQCKGGPDRVWSPSLPELEACLSGEGRPLIIADALQACPALREWTWDYFATRHVSAPVLVNNHAPARHADARPGGGGAQRTLALTLGAYIEGHVHGAPAAAGAPFYLNGWRAFSEAGEAWPDPAWARGIDQTAELMAALDATLFSGRAAPAARGMPANAAATSAPPAVTGTSPPAWVAALDAALSKLFLGPAGTVTRLHYDAGGAHGWLAQARGRKLFVLLPPSAAAALHMLAGEPETAQSPVDPLAPDAARFPLYSRAEPLACTLTAGEALLVPAGWWHYAVALEPSVTLQRNFYHAGSNVKALVGMVLKTAAGLKGKASQ